MSSPFGDGFLKGRATWMPPGGGGPNDRTEIKNKAVVKVVPAAAPSTATRWFATAAFAVAVSLTTAHLGKAHAETGGRSYGAAVVSESAVDRAWGEYLAHLRRPAGRFSGHHIDLIIELWSYARRLNSEIPPPHTAPTEDGALELVWDSGPHHIEIDIWPNSRVEWFYSNRDSGQFEGKDARIGQLPQLLAQRLKSIA